MPTPEYPLMKRAPKGLRVSTASLAARFSPNIGYLVFGDNHLMVAVTPVFLMRYEDIAYWSLIYFGAGWRF